ncbi:hypothetical protein CFP56_002109 [Quercus suber]|uniref:Cytochrome c oxidase assembly factor 3 mitochondrial coiled-coil domain-containing protein n=2 Tax=Quercus suber TaxID=58331 RepID=A0AAW0M9K8_QUESU
MAQKYSLKTQPCLLKTEFPKSTPTEVERAEKKLLSNHHRNQRSQSALNFCLQMAGFSSLAPKMKNLVVAGSLTGFVFSVYFYTMRAVASGDELQVAIDKFEEQKSKPVSTMPPKV